MPKIRFRSVTESGAMVSSVALTCSSLLGAYLERLRLSPLMRMRMRVSL